MLFSSGVEWHWGFEQTHSTPKHPFMYNHGSKLSNKNQHVDQSLELEIGQLDLLVMSLSKEACSGLKDWGRWMKMLTELRFRCMQCV